MSGGTLSSTRPAAAIDALWRLAYRVAFRLLRLWWRVRRPEHRGAVVALWLGGEILMLWSSYRDTLDFPGGGLARGEAPRAGACRELAEELGLALDEGALRPAREWVGWWDHRHDHVTIFEHRLAAPPTLRLDNREIVAARFMTPQAALAAPLAPFVRAYLVAAAHAIVAAARAARS